MIDAAVIDAHSAFRDFLIAASPLRTFLNGDFVYWPEVPGGGDPAMPGKAVAFRFNGGISSAYLPVQDARVSMRSYGETAYQAMEVYRLLYARLHGQQNFIVGDVGFYGAHEQVPGVPLEDPITGWPYVFSVVTLRLATVPVTDGAGGS